MSKSNRKKTNKKSVSLSGRKVGNIFSSPPIKLNWVKDETEFYRADIEFFGIDISGPSYEGRVFLNNPKADESTGLVVDNGYAGSYYIFGHGGCYGDAGHCEIKPRRTFDSRTEHDLTPAYKSMIATEAIKKILKNTKEIVISVVPITARSARMGNVKDIVFIDKIRISCYENYSKLNK
jgi:tyrosinase